MNTSFYKIGEGHKEGAFVQDNPQPVTTKILELRQKSQSKVGHIEAENDASCLKRLRQNLGFNRTEAQKLLGMSISSIKRYETGVTPLTKSKLEQFLTGYCVNHHEYLNFKVGKETKFLKPKVPQQPQVIKNKNLRRSYKKVITNEARAITRLRRQKGISQCEASRLCGWSRCSIGHIEHGRIELTEKKINHILSCLGITMKKFRAYANIGPERESIEEECIKIIQGLEYKKLSNIHTILKTF